MKMRKLLLLIVALLTLGVSGAWATTYTVVNGSDLPSSLGTFSLSGSGYNSSYSSNALSGLTITSDGYLMKEGSSNNADYGKCFVVSSSPVKTAQISINAPAGYTIAGYTIKGKGGNGGVTFSIKGSDGTTQDLAALTYGGITVSGLCSTTETITITSNTANKEIWFNTLTVDLVSATSLSVTYKVRYNDATVHTTSAVSTCVGTKPLLPAIDTRGYCSYKYYSDEACESEITTLAAENTIVYAKCTLSDAPFEFATSVEDANTNNKWKEFKLADNTHYVYYNGSTLAYDATDLSTIDGYQWALIGTPYGYKIYNKGAEKYLKASVPTSNNATTSEFSFDNEGLTFELYRYYSTTDNGHFVSVVTETNTNVRTATVLNYSNGWKIWCGKDNTAGFYCNNGRMNGLSQSFLLPFDVPSTFTVAYNVNNYAGTQVATANIEVAAGDTGDDAANHLPSALRKDGCTYTYSPTTVSESNNVITVTYTYAPGYGFDVYNDYESISEWRFLKLNDANYIVYNSENSPNVQRTTTLSDVNNASWAFVGNPYEGIKIYNKGAGNTVWLTSSTPDVNDGTTGGGGNTSVTLASSGDKQVWYLSTSTYFTNGFFLGNNDGYKLNGRAGSTNVSYWMGGADGGSTFVAINVSEQFATLKNATKFDILEGSTVVGPSEFAAPAEINAAIDAAQNVADNDEAKWAFIQSENGTMIKNYLDQVATYGALANIKITMSKEYGTMILPCPATRISGLDIYSCSAQENGVLTLTPVDGDYAYNVPYIIHATAGSKYTIIGWDKGSTATHTSGWLTGVLNSTTDIPGGSYMLATNKTTGVQAFYQVSGEGVKCAINKCYLTVSSGGSVKAFYFDEDGKTTAIEEIFGGEAEQGAIYNLAGQRLQKLQKGINIINGKKIIK